MWAKKIVESKYYKPLKIRPPYIAHGSPAFIIPKNLLEKHNEKVLGIQLVANRKLFGLCYQQLLTEYFDSMPRNSGVMIRGFVPMQNIIEGFHFPGDIDLLVIPYEEETLVLSKTLVIELKVVRATFAKQGKSPNQFGFSQAKALLDIGFPYVAVAHLIVSEPSPPESWREVIMAYVINSETGELGDLRYIKIDMLPADLINRCFGRLEANCRYSDIGLLAVYIANKGIWLPTGRQAKLNPRVNQKIMDAVWEYYCINAYSFFDTRRYD